MRIGIDWGGTKIEAIALADDGSQLWRERIPTPQGDYEGSLGAAVDLIARLERETGQRGTIGVGLPGTIDARTGIVRNANSTWLNGKPVGRDLCAAFGRDIRWDNDANCLALSEATDGAGCGSRVLFAAILGTGCGGGIAVEGQVHAGSHGVAGEWGHNPLPWQSADEYPGEPCYCGRRGCLETWVSGPAFEREYARVAGRPLRAPEIVRRSDEGDSEAAAFIARYEDRLARGLAHVVNILDPDVIVLGGGMSRIARLYRTLPALIRSYVFGGDYTTAVLPAMHGDSSGVRGAAALWPLEGASHGA